MFVGGGLTYGILLLALGAGYIVCYLAEREEKALRFLGLVIGSVIIAVSAALLLNNLLLSARICGARSGEMGMMPMHRMMKAGKMPSAEGAKGKAMMAPAQQQPEQKK